MRKAAPQDIALGILENHLGREVEMDGAARVPVSMNAGVLESLRSVVTLSGYFLCLHIEGAEIVSAPPMNHDQKMEDIMSVHVWLLPCADGKWRLGASPDDVPKTPAQMRAERLSESFTAGSGKEIPVQRPLKITPRKPPGPG
ncbi:MAG: hypothetical protein GC185_07935 [Alphaproteobacteria bacterium]|nr:hypothetical protein [Alphaproteobacteria bacterium]